MKIWYSVQSTGLGHFIPYRALAGALSQQGHELITLTVGPTLPSFLKPVGSKHYHLQGPTLIMDHLKLDYLKTSIHNVVHLPEFISNFFKLKRWIEREKPDLVIEDYEPFTSNFLRFFEPTVPSFSVDHQSVFVSPMFPLGKVDYRLKLVTKIFTYARQRLCASFVDYGKSGAFMTVPPILREEVLRLPISDDGSVLVYHSTAEAENKEILKKTCSQKWKFVFYGYEPEIYRNITFKPKGDDFLEDLSKCHVFITNCGVCSVCEALILGKQVICQPLKGHSEQEWNGRILKHFRNVKVVPRVNYGDLNIEETQSPEPDKINWLRHGLEEVLRHILKDQDCTKKVIARSEATKQSRL